MQDRDVTAEVEALGAEAGESADEHEMEQAADLEARMATLASRVVELEEDLRAAKASLESSEREQALDAAIRGAGAVDEETVRVLVKRSMEASPELGASEAVADLKDRKPALFRRAGAPASAMAARVSSSEPAGLLEAKRAAAEGDRASLLRYLRLRREGS
jgi:hypothetical protein